MGTMNFSARRKLFGVNIIPTPTEVATGVPAWTNLFIDWDWTGWVKKQIDYAVGNGIGCNCIGLIGCMDGVHAATITQSTVNSRWTQVAAYCAGLRVYLYPKLCAFNQMSGVTNSECSTYVLSILSALAPYSNVIGCDVIVEANTWDDGGGAGVQAVANRCNAIYTLVKAGTSIPCTFSSTYEWSGSTSKTWGGWIAAGVDYWDFHPYEQSSWPSPMVLASGNYWLTTYPSNDIFFGEGGAPQSETVDQQNTFLRSVGAVMNTGDARYRGWVMWAAQDQDTVSSNKWGLFDASWNERQNIANVMRQFTGGSVARAN